METYLTCEVAFTYGISLRKARRLTEDEKQGYAKWYREKGFVGTGDHISLDALVWDDVKTVLNNRDYDGCFAGCENEAYIISQDEWDQLVALNDEKTWQSKKAEIEAEIKTCKEILSACEKQEKLYTKAEAKAKRDWYNNTFNEGGEGYVPEFYTADQYNYYKDELSELEAALAAR